MKDYEPYILHEDRSVDGEVTVSRAGPAPERIVVSLELLAKSDARFLSVHYNELHILTDRYQVVGWDGDAGALVCHRLDA